MVDRSLADWLRYQQQVHPQGIALGLDRVREVARRLALPRPAPVCITVGGTNGKGSTVAFIEAMLREARVRVGAFTSPHLLRYNERVRIDGVDVDDASLVASFARIDAARGEIPLTYFEFGTLAAFDVIARAGVDVAVLEVGLGGRLDAVNLVDANVAIVTTVDFDHQEWLGDDREAIGFEKAGIFRPGRVAIAGESHPPASLVAHARAIGASLQVAGDAFDILPAGEGGLVFRHRDGARFDVPMPALSAPAQPRNAACAIAALHALRDRVPVPADAIARGVASARAAGRLQQLASAPSVVVDVAHNPQAARELAAWLAASSSARDVALFAALGDKDITGIVAPLARAFAHWHLVPLTAETPRGLDVAMLAHRVRDAAPDVALSRHETIEAALAAARRDAGADGRVVAFGSFFTVAATMAAIGVGHSGQ